MLRFPNTILVSDTILIPVALNRSSIERLPARSKLPHDTSLLCSRYCLKFPSRVTFPHLPRCYQPDSQPFRGLLFRSYPLSFVSTMEFPKEGCQLHHDDLKQENEDINVMDQPLREKQPRPRRLVRISRPNPFPLTSPLKSRDEISCSGGEL